MRLLAIMAFLGLAGCGSQSGPVQKTATPELWNGLYFGDSIETVKNKLPQAERLPPEDSASPLLETLERPGLKIGEQTFDLTANFANGELQEVGLQMDDPENREEACLDVRDALEARLGEPDQLIDPFLTGFETPEVLVRKMKWRDAHWRADGLHVWLYCFAGSENYEGEVGVWYFANGQRLDGGLSPGAKAGQGKTPVLWQGLRYGDPASAMLKRFPGAELNPDGPPDAGQDEIVRLDRFDVGLARYSVTGYFQEDRLGQISLRLTNPSDIFDPCLEPYWALEAAVGPPDQIEEARDTEFNDAHFAMGATEIWLRCVAPSGDLDAEVIISYFADDLKIDGML